jgi:hypothetical protein
MRGGGLYGKASKIGGRRLVAKLKAARDRKRATGARAA